MLFCFILRWLVFGAAVGYLARWINPGDEKLGGWATVLVGVAGSFVGGAIGYLLGWNEYLFGSSGFLMSILGAVILCALWTRFGDKINWGK